MESPQQRKSLPVLKTDISTPLPQGAGSMLSSDAFILIDYTERDYFLTDTTEDVNNAGEVSSPQQPTKEDCSPSACTERICNSLRKLSIEHMMDTAKNDGNENEGISRLPQGTSAANHDASFGPVQVEQRSVASQTLSRAQVNSLVAAGKLSKWREADPREENKKAPVKRSDDDPCAGEPHGVMTSRLGVKIVKAESQEQEDNSAHEGGEEGNAEETDQPAEPGVISNQGEPSADKAKTDRLYLAYETVTDDSDFEYLSGMSRAAFGVLYSYLSEEVSAELIYETGGTFGPLRDCRISLKGRLFMTLCHLRKGYLDREISILFGCSEDQASSIINTWVNFIYLEFKPLEDVLLQHRISQKQGTSKSFESSKQLKLIVVCTEIRVEAEAPSDERSCDTVKYLVGISVMGTFLYVSEAFSGAMSDKEVFMKSSLYELLRPGDVVLLAHEGFDVAHELDSLGVELRINSYLKGRFSHTPEEKDMEEEEEDMEEDEEEDMEEEEEKEKDMEEEEEDMEEDEEEDMEEEEEKEKDMEEEEEDMEEKEKDMEEEEEDMEEEEEEEEEEEDMEEEQGMRTRKDHVPKLVRTSELVEKTMERLGEWRVLNHTFPHSLVPFLSEMMLACAYLTNFQPPLLMDN